MWDHHTLLQSIKVDWESDLASARVEDIGHAHRIAVIEELLKAKGPILSLRYLLLQLCNYLEQLRDLCRLTTLTRRCSLELRISLTHDIRCSDLTVSLSNHLFEVGLIYCLTVVLAVPAC